MNIYFHAHLKDCFNSLEEVQKARSLLKTIAEQIATIKNKKYTKIDTIDLIFINDRFNYPKTEENNKIIEKLAKIVKENKLSFIII